jgi:predicted flap endonuclease-1-like 5' DNA nuclease
LRPDEVAAIDADLGAFKGRLTRDRVIEQAAFLARGDQAGYEAAFGKL